MADVTVVIFKGNENFRNITQTITLDSKKLCDFAKVLRTVQISTNEALQQLVEAAKGDNILSESDNEDGDDENSEDECKVVKRKKEEPAQRKHTRKKFRRH